MSDCKQKLHVGDTGTRIELNIDPCGAAGIVQGDITDAKIIVKKPDGSITEWAATQDGNLIYYVTQHGDLDHAGVWTLQAKCTLNGGWSGRGSEVRVYVYA